jgi:hypothetical protein
MANIASAKSEGNPFGGAIDVPHKRVDPCFMTGKGCVYTELIERSIRKRRDDGGYLGFSVMPFRENMNVFFKNCLSLFFSGNYGSKVSLQRADEVRRPGIIICEGVCKRIQESDFVTVDISVPNPNVFYELGLAYGMGHKIIVIYHDSAQFGNYIAEGLKQLGCRSYSYHDLDPIQQEEFGRALHVWQHRFDDAPAAIDNQRILLYEHQFPPVLPEKERVTDKLEDIVLPFGTHVRSAVGLAIERICQELGENKDQRVIHSYLETILKFKEAVTVKTEASLHEIQEQVDSAYCMIIRTGFKTCHPMAYFWLGYGHARGKNVVPVTVLTEKSEAIEDLAFDIRAQRHMVFIEKAPDRFEAELTSSLKQMIISDFSEWSRKRFWDRMLGRRGEVSIFTGALHNDTFGREMIGDWDLRAASELTSYFASQQYRAKIENPVYAPEYPKGDQGSPVQQYIPMLKEMLVDKNCILIASPDVNPLTEIVLGHIYNVPNEFLFADSVDLGRYPNAIVVVKERRPTKEIVPGAPAKRFFYREIPASNEGALGRGFVSAQLIDGKILEKFISQVDKGRNDFLVFGHLVILPNPFRKEDQQHERFIIVLNGVSGPATFALTHVLTGGVTKEFVSYDEDFNSDAESEEVLSSLLQNMERRHFKALDCIVAVRVGVGKESQRSTAWEVSDWRRILRWKLNEEARQPSIKVLP